MKESAMKNLYVLYDERCAICKRLRDWLLVQRSWIGLSMMAAGSARAKAMFPGLEQIAAKNDLVVISDAGEVYLNNHAWIMCLYALEEYREWALRLASPLLLPLARQAWETLSKNRQAISRWIGSSEQQLATELNGVTLEACGPQASGSQPRPKPDLENNVGEYLR
jgi:predicted DCC family thiol-disulfide oxidoreductase YuxK